jgi:4-diphosphocytidyl-2-C-methyl-D-erythritol kinase
MDCTEAAAAVEEDIQMSIIAGLAPAKINLSLRVVSRRPDGFHDIDTLVVFLDLCDSLVFSPAGANRQELRVTGRVAHVPADGRNLVLRAAEALSDHVDRDLPFSGVLDKRIPTGAGLGGGSSDAATTLTILNTMHGLHLSTDQLSRIGAAVGSDVPLFVTSNGGSCRVRGRGEVVEPLDWAPRGWCVLIIPPVHCPTPAVYAAWDRTARSSPADRRVPCDCGEAPGDWLASCFNDLQEAAFELFPPLAQIQRQATSLCGRPVTLTGSGSTLFTAFDEPVRAGQAADRLSGEMDVETVVVPLRTWAGNPMPEVQYADHGDSCQARA